MGASPQDSAIAQRLLAGLASETFYPLAVEALRRWKKGARSSEEFQMHGDFGRALVPILAERIGIQADAQTVKEPFLYEQGQPWMGEVVMFTWWLARSGLAIPVYQGDIGYPAAYRLTAAGAAFLDATVEHPMLPGFLQRIAARCPGLPDETITHLTDARACLDHALSRPSIVLLGLAFEVAIDAVVDTLVSDGKLSVKAKAKVSEKIGGVKAILPQLFPAAEERSTAIAAWDFADALRQRRNHGAHPRPAYDFSDLTEVHELHVSAGRHLPALWSTGRT